MKDRNDDNDDDDDCDGDVGILIGNVVFVFVVVVRFVAKEDEGGEPFQALTTPIDDLSNRRRVGRRTIIIIIIIKFPSSVPP